MEGMNKNALIEATKELLRVVLLAVVPVLITGVENGSVEPSVIATVALLAGLRFIDKLLHETGKENKNDSLKKGLTRF